MTLLEKLRLAHSHLVEGQIAIALQYIQELIADNTDADAATVKTIFEYWQKVMNSPKSKLDGSRKGVIVRALKNYSPGDVCKAIRGCSKSPHHMGENAQKTVYNSLGLILRNADHIDRFILLDAGCARSATESIAQTNARVMAEMLGNAPTDSMTIEMQT